MISSVPPSDWKDLQFQIARILGECGMTVAIEQRIHTPRGNVVVDVHAEESIAGRRHLILVECKYWASRVPQNVIHGFRTVTIETGAHQGYVISRSGFQPGAITATRQTNLELLTWPEFQDAFEVTWLDRHFHPSVRAAFDRKNKETQAAIERWQRPTSELERAKHEERSLKILGKYVTFYEIMRRHVLRKGALPALPIRESLKSEWQLDGTMPDEILDAIGYREFLEAARTYADVAVSEWHADLVPA